MSDNIEDLIPGMKHISLNRRTSFTGDLTYGNIYYDISGNTNAFPTHTMPAKNAYQLIHDSLLFDGNPALNCATFLTTWMEPEAEKLIAENLGKNRVDISEYEATERIHRHSLSFLADLWKAPKGKPPVGTVVIGSSEGIMLGGLAMKWRWRERRRAAGLDVSKPNIVFGANSQVALEKTARYFDIESRLVPVSSESRYVLDTKAALEMIDENTIGMFIILGSTYTGHFENVEEMAHLLDELNEEKGLDIPLHIDGASGAFVAPFSNPDLKWGFEIPRVVSISTSGHKFGLTYPGIGWVLWRDQEYQPEDLCFELSYLGGIEKTFTLNFSHPACFMIGQYYNFIRFGREGYTRIMNTCLVNARLLSVALEATGVFECVSDIHRPRGVFGYSEENRLASNALMLESTKNIRSVADPDINKPYNVGAPLVAFKFRKEFMERHPDADQDALSTLLRVRGWIIPNYPLPPNSEDIEVMRVVVKEAMSEDLVDRIVRDIMWGTQTMVSIYERPLGEALKSPLPANSSTSNLAHQVAESSTKTIPKERTKDHWNNLLKHIGIDANKKDKTEAPVKLTNSGRSKSVYEKSC